MRQASRTTALIAVGMVGALGVACGNGSATPVEHSPTALPSGSHASPSLCKTYFGLPASIAKEFDVASLKRVPFWESQGGHTYFLQVYSSDGTIMCKYLRPGPTGDGTGNDGLFLTLRTHEDFSSGGGATIAVGKSGAVYAYAETDDPHIHVSQTDQVWLQRAAARARSPKATSVVSASIRSACSEIESQRTLSVGGQPGQVVFAFSSSLIDALHHSGNTTLDEVGTQLVSAATSDDPRSANAAIVRAKSVCHSLVQ